MSLTSAKILKRALRGPTFQSAKNRDTFLASYPRSGNTWLRTVIFHASVGRAPKNLAEVDLGVPDEHAPPPRRKMLMAAQKLNEAIVKTHQPYRSTASYRKVIYIIRDPRDVIPSYFRYLRRKGAVSEDEFENFAVGCICGTVWPGSWFEHVTSWRFFQSQYPKRACIFIYENLVAYDEVEVMKFGKALPLQHSIDISEIFRRYDLEMMKRLEKRGNRLSERAPGFIGQGAARSDMRRCVDTLIKQHAPHWQELMADYGYV